jgi:hypothetical protein
VKADLGQAVSLHPGLEQPGRALRVERSPGRLVVGQPVGPPGERKALVHPPGTELELVGRLRSPVLFQDLDRLGVQVDDPWLVALGQRLTDDLAPDGPDRLTDDRRLSVPVDVLPAQAQGLTAPDAGRGDEVPQGELWVLLSAARNCRSSSAVQTLNSGEAACLAVGGLDWVAALAVISTSLIAWPSAADRMVWISRTDRGLSGPLAGLGLPSVSSVL